jgi:hypothetical protein
MTLACAGALLGCAASPDRTRESHPVFKSYTSSSAPEVVAKCLQKELPGLNAEFGDGEIVVTNRNQFGTILIAWYIRASGSGSSIDVRRAQSVAPGITKAERCFGS